MIHVAAITENVAPPDYRATITVPIVAQAPPLNGAPDGSWAQAARISLAVDQKNRTVDPHPATVYLEASGHDLYIAWIVPQTAPVTADQRQNDTGLGHDDIVIAYLYPDGPSGFEYAFASNPIGTHFAISTENSAFSPSWQSKGERTKDGYAVYMKVPLDVMKGGRNGTWRANFRRFVSKTLDDYDWTYNAQTMAGNDPQTIVAGTIAGLPVSKTSVRPQPRIGTYVLGEAASPSVGGSTSRLGIDASIPITAKTTFVSTIHPDYSNVEIDQATISPTAFPRYYQDVRPFFTQLSNDYNQFACFSCTGLSPLYTTAIPTPRYGNAVEGKEGPFSFAAFDAAGIDRNDNAEVVQFTSPNQKLNVSAQRQGASLPGLVDTTDLQSATYDSQRGFDLSAFQSEDRGTFVTDAGAGLWTQYGIGTYDKTSGAYLTWQRIGSQYNPFDGYVPNNGLSGLSGSIYKTWYLASESAIPRVVVDAFEDRFVKPDGTLGQADTNVALGFDLQHVLHVKSLMHVHVQSGSSWVQLPDGTLAAASQNGIDFFSNFRTATQDQLSYYSGRFGPGTLDYWTRIVNLRLARAVALTLEADDGDQRLDDGERNKQWLERGSVVWQRTKYESLSVGVRRIVGPSPVLEFAQLPSTYYNDWNVSAGYYKRFPHDEFYFVYGDASQLSTYPAFFFKYIHYFGAEKGV